MSIKCTHLLCKQAYKNFGNRVKTLKSKLEEKMKTLPEPSPVPSPTVDAPSPENSEDEDLGLPDAGTSGKSSLESQVKISVCLFKLNCIHDMFYVYLLTLQILLNNCLVMWECGLLVTNPQ